MAYIKNTWADREGQTRYHETIDDDGALIFTPDYEKVTEMGTPVNADNMNHIEEGIEDHENRITVLEEGGDASNFLNKTQITNCLLEVPQNINLELTDGVLTLKAGSKVIVPNGVGVFDEVVTTQDYSKSKLGTETGQLILLWGKTAWATTTPAINYFSANIESGDTEITPRGNNWCWYDTANNIVKTTADKGATWVDVDTPLPLAIVSCSNGTITSIDQVFNGFGYIGSHLWVDKGVKGLIPNGFNSDGTLNNIEFTTPNVIVSSRVLTQKSIPVWYKDNNTITFSTGWSYIESTNKVTATHDGVTTSPYCQIATVDMANGVISNFRPKQPFRAVDWNDLQHLIDSEIGKPQFTLHNQLPSNCVWLEGSTVSRTTYANLFAIYGTTYGGGDGSTTFTLPDFRNRTIWGSSSFGYLEAGLPNITASVSFGDGLELKTLSGAFYNAGSGSNPTAKGDGTPSNLGFDASRSNSIYGNSTTVQPPAIKVRVYTRYQ